MVINGWNIQVYIKDGSIKSDGRFYIDIAEAETQMSLLRRMVGEKNIGFNGKYCVLEKESRSYESKNCREFIADILSAVDVEQRSGLRLELMRRTEKSPIWTIVVSYVLKNSEIIILGLFSFDETQTIPAQELLDLFAENKLRCNISYEYYETWKWKQDMRQLVKENSH